MATITNKTQLTTSKGVDFDCYLSPKDKSWRLVHDGKQVLAYFESSGTTGTTNMLFVGTQAQCEAEIAKLGLTPLESDEIIGG